MDKHKLFLVSGEKELDIINSFIEEKSKTSKIVVSKAITDKVIAVVWHEDSLVTTSGIKLQN